MLVESDVDESADEVSRILGESAKARILVVEEVAVELLPFDDIKAKAEARGAGMSLGCVTSTAELIFHTSGASTRRAGELTYRECRNEEITVGGFHCATVVAGCCGHDAGSGLARRSRLWRMVVSACERLSRSVTAKTPGEVSIARAHAVLWMTPGRRMTLRE